MAEASVTILGGFELRSDAKLVRWPDHYTDPRGDDMWALVSGLLDEMEAAKPIELFTSEQNLFTSDQPVQLGLCFGTSLASKIVTLGLLLPLRSTVTKPASSSHLARPTPCSTKV
jgi:hypothetical protein